MQHHTLPYLRMIDSMIAGTAKPVQLPPYIMVHKQSLVPAIAL